MPKDTVTILPFSAPSTAPSSPVKVRRRPSNQLRKEIAVFLAEFVGTFMFLFIGFAGAQIALESVPVNSTVPADQNPPPEVSKLIYISFAFGAGLAVNVAIFADVSGGMFNPAVTTALWIIGLIKWPRAIHSIVAQLSAGIASAFVVSALLPGPLTVTTKLDPSMSVTRGLFLEMFLTAQLVLTILMLPAGASKPMYVGVALFIAQICGVFFTGGSLNPARSLGPAVVTGFEWYHWIYWLGPALGAGLASGAFALVKSAQRREP